MMKTMLQFIHEFIYYLGVHIFYIIIQMLVIYL